MLLLVPLVQIVPAKWIFGDIALTGPVWNVASDEGLPKLGIFTFDLGRAQLYFVELVGGLDSCEDFLDLRILKAANIGQTCGPLARSRSDRIGILTADVLDAGLGSKIYERRDRHDW